MKDIVIHNLFTIDSVWKAVDGCLSAGTLVCQPKMLPEGLGFTSVKLLPLGPIRRHRRSNTSCPPAQLNSNGHCWWSELAQMTLP